MLLLLGIGWSCRMIIRRSIIPETNWEFPAKCDFIHLKTVLFLPSNGRKFRNESLHLIQISYGNPRLVTWCVCSTLGEGAMDFAGEIFISNRAHIAFWNLPDVKAVFDKFHFAFNINDFLSYLVNHLLKSRIVCPHCPGASHLKVNNPLRNCLFPLKDKEGISTNSFSANVELERYFFLNNKNRVT